MAAMWRASIMNFCTKNAPRHFINLVIFSVNLWYLTSYSLHISNKFIYIYRFSKVNLFRFELSFSRSAIWWLNTGMKRHHCVTPFCTKPSNCNRCRCDGVERLIVRKVASYWSIEFWLHCNHICQNNPCCRWNPVVICWDVLQMVHKVRILKNAALRMSKAWLGWYFNSLIPDDAICHRTQSTVFQVMAWCCQAPSHYLNQCWPS